MESFSQPTSGTQIIKASGPEALDAQRDVITKLYWDEGLDRAEVNKVMQFQYRFKATYVIINPTETGDMLTQACVVRDNTRTHSSVGDFKRMLPVQI